MPKRLIFVNVAVAITLLFSVVMAAAQPQEPYPVGEITIIAKQVAAGVGYTWGTGTLKFKGKTYPFTIKGVNVAAVGISKFTAKGDVFNLTKPTDLAGTYLTAGAGAAIYKGKGGLVMRNDKGVVINLTSDQTGVQLSLGSDGMKITMK
ncbi:MAG: DUF1134 domain-containing protein [Deltaproteobacteria bacterium]|nr:DUF1134 domain-containing protein [Deltaproteobacteria bacterium]